MSTFHSLREDKPGCWFLEFPDPHFEPLSFSKFLEEFRNIFLKKTERRERIELVVDLRNLGVPPDFSYIQSLVSFLTETDSLRAERCGSTLIVAPNATVQSLVRMVCALRPPCTPVDVVGELPLDLLHKRETQSLKSHGPGASA